MAKSDGEPTSAPQPERWYELKLGSSFKDHPSSKFCTLRYEFKPASIDKSQRGMLHKNKDNRVTVEFNNNQPGKPKVAFEGTSEDYKDNDGVMFFDGESFRLERLHRAVKRLRHVRLPGESAAAVNITSAVTNVPAVESRSPPLMKTLKPPILNKPTHPAMCLEVERIDIGDAESSGAAKHAKRSSDMYHPTPPNTKSHGPDDDNVDILEEDDDGEDRSPPKPDRLGLDMNLPNPNNGDSDDEIADVDASDDESNKGPNAAEALRAQVTAAEEGQLQGRQQGGETSSSSGSGSASGSSGSGSASGTSSSSDSDDSDRADSASSGGDVDI